jgi:acyl-CoA reductase-like NAD-dependent aldehyde dehydrogenase
LLEENIEQLARVLSTEVGKPLQQSRNEINGARTRIKWMVDHAERFLSDELMTTAEGLQEKISYEPLGVVCNISAWNYPWLVGVNVFVPALLAGNAVMYKPSEYSTLTGLEIERLLKKPVSWKMFFILLSVERKLVRSYCSLILMVIFLPVLIKQVNIL